MVKQRWLPREQPSTIGAIIAGKVRWWVKHASQRKNSYACGKVEARFFSSNKPTAQLRTRQRSCRLRRFCGHEAGLGVGRQSIWMGCNRRIAREKCSGRLGAPEQILLAVDGNRSPSKARTWLQDAWNIFSGLTVRVCGMTGRTEPCRGELRHLECERAFPPEQRERTRSQREKVPAQLGAAWAETLSRTRTGLLIEGMQVRREGWREKIRVWAWSTLPFGRSERGRFDDASGRPRQPRAVPCMCRGRHGLGLWRWDDGMTDIQDPRPPDGRGCQCRSGHELVRRERQVGSEAEGNVVILACHDDGEGTSSAHQ